MLPLLTLLRTPKTASTALKSFRSYSSTDVIEEIVIPKRIHRSSTDILKALESTIKRDPTAPHYKYHDDPFLIPTSNLSKRSYALAQESGRKAAHWVREQNRELFLHQEAEPMIKSFAPKIVYDETSNVLEEDLQKVIKDAHASDAIFIYNSLKEKGIQISSETKESLLALLCYYNHTDPVPEEFIEERWFRQSNKGKERQRRSWKDSGLAEEIYISIEKPTAKTYGTLIQGMTKYGQIDRAWHLFQESQQKGLVLSTETFNCILASASFIKEGNDLRWNFIIDTLTAMRQAQVKPNLGTLNAVVKTLSMMGSGKMIKTYVLQTISEFKNLGIEPSLATWYYVLITFCKERGPTNLILKDIVNHLNSQTLELRDLKDTYFFVTAMDVCRFHLHDNALAKDVHNLLHLNNHYDLIGDSYKESIYYRHYVCLMCETESFDTFMEKVYYSIVPHIYVPEVGVMLEILQSLDVNAAFDYLPNLWSDIVIFDHTDREKIIELVLDIMVHSNLPASTSDLPQKYADIAWAIWEKLNETNDSGVSRITPTATQLGKIMTVLLRGKEYNKANTVLEVLNKNQSLGGVPSFDSLSLFVEYCIEHKLPNRALNCIQYATEHGFDDATNLAFKLNKMLTLDGPHLEKLRKIFGYDIFQNAK